MSEAAVLTALEHLSVVPVVEVERPQDAVSLAYTLVEAGLPVLELTLRTPSALVAIERVAAECPDILLGAGTLLNADMVRAAHGSGARFGVSPGVFPAAMQAASDVRLPFVPGVVTPSEVLVALDAGLRYLKFFPAGAYGGRATLAALSGPFALAGVRFMPTGGITPDNAPDYLSVPSVFAVGGTWVAPRKDIAAGRWDQIGERARAAVELVRAVRQQEDR